MTQSANRGLQLINNTLAAPGASDAGFFRSGGVLVQIDGSATDAKWQVQRSTRDPSGSDGLGGANWAPMNASLEDGNPSAGLVPVAYQEAGMAWWRVSVTAVTGGAVNVSLSGQLP